MKPVAAGFRPDHQDHPKNKKVKIRRSRATGLRRREAGTTSLASWYACSVRLVHASDSARWPYFLAKRQNQQSRFPTAGCNAEPFVDKSVLLA
jgi:hypothetical protein